MLTRVCCHLKGQQTQKLSNFFGVPFLHPVRKGNIQLLSCLIHKSQGRCWFSSLCDYLHVSHRTTKWWSLKRALEIIWSNPLTLEDSSRAGCPGLCPNTTWIFTTLFNLRQKSSPMLHWPHSKKQTNKQTISTIPTVTVFQFLFIVSCPVTRHYCKESWHFSCI